MTFLTKMGKMRESFFGNNRSSKRRKQHEEKTRRTAGGRKSRSLQIDNTKPVSGVFVSARTLSTMGSNHPPSISSFTSDSNDFLCRSWKSSGDKCHNNNAPLIAQNPDKNDGFVTDAARRLGMAMARSRKLPDTWYYSSNHILVNQERVQRTIAPLTRMIGLDEIARLHAEDMAEAEEVHHLDLEPLRLALENVNCHRLGVNVQRGESIRDIHDVMMQVLSNKNNILDRRFTHMGMGTAVDKDGRLYLCQIFRG